MTDGNREAGFYGHATVTYEDAELEQDCSSIYKTGTETQVFYCGGGVRTEKEELEFSSLDAEGILKEKLAVLDIKEIHISKIYLYESSDFMFYEIQFTPAFEGNGIAHEFGEVRYGEVFPNGVAWICEDGVAKLECNDFCMEVSEKTEQAKLLSFSQIQKILEIYLNNGALSGSTKIIMSNIEFLYYPIFQEEDQSLKLVPVWRIGIPLYEVEENSEYADEWIKGAAWNIYINAVTGEIEKAE